MIDIHEVYNSCVMPDAVWEKHPLAKRWWRLPLRHISWLATAADV